MNPAPNLHSSKEVLSTPEPLVSVIIPAYNAERFILEALESIDTQRYLPLEILLIDDGSTDGTVELVRRHAPNVQIVSQPTAGASAARNTGLRLASGEFICFLDADDGWFPGKLAAQTDYLVAHPEVGIVYHEWHVRQSDASGVFQEPQFDLLPKPSCTIDPGLSGWIYPHLLFECCVHTSTVMMRRSIAHEIGYFDTDLVTGEDYDYWLRASQHCEIHKLAATLSFYRSTPGGLTSKPTLTNNEFDVICRAIRRWGLISADGTVVPKPAIEARLARLAFSFGYLHYHLGSFRLARGAFLTALRHAPLDWKAAAYLTASTARSLFDKR